MPWIFNQRFPTNAVAWSINPGATTSPDNMSLFITRNEYKTFMQYPTIVFKGESVGPWDIILNQLRGYAKNHVTSKHQFIYMVGAVGKGCRFFRYKMGEAVPTTCMVYNPATKIVSYKDTTLATTSDIVVDQEVISCFMDEITSHPVPLLPNDVEFDTERSDVQADVEVGK